MKIASVVITLFLLGCSDQKADPVPPVSSDLPTDKWLGQWAGPEGTFLRLAGGNGTYDITIQNLDGPLNFQGTAVGNRIRFERNGVNEFIQATNGVETGMKWLSDKTNCLTVHPGEGYCRD